MTLLYNLPSISNLQIELTTRCNASCPVCTRNFFGGPVAPDLEMVELSLADIQLMFPDEITQNLQFINYCGNLGDCALASDLIPILKFFKEKSLNCVKQQIRTNGGMRSPEFWNELGSFFKNQNLDLSNPLSNGGVVFSVDGLEDTNHLYRRGVVWKKLYANMESYSKAGGYAIWEWLVFDHNKHQINDAKTLAESLGFSLVLKNPLGYLDEQSNPQGRPVYNKDGSYAYTLYPANYKGKKEELKWFGEKVDFTKLQPPPLDFQEPPKYSTINCKSINRQDQEIFVTPTGHLLPCCYLGGPFSGVSTNTMYSRRQFRDNILKIGLDQFDLRKNKMIDILTGPNFSKFFLSGWEANTVKDGKLLHCVETCGERSSMDNIYFFKK